MENYGKSLRHVKLDASYDVIVIGGGPAGCAAAIASAREGKKTLLLEAKGALGGMGTTGLVPAWCPFDDGEKVIYRGIALKIFEESKKGVPQEPKDKTSWVRINPEYLKRVYDDAVLSSGADVLFHTTVASVELSSEGVADAVIAANKGGLTAYKAAAYVDCTGDGDVAAWAGADFAYGSAEGKTQASTLCFTATGVNDFHYQIGGPSLWCGNLDSPVWKIYFSEKYKDLKNYHLCTGLQGPGTVGFNSGHLFDVNPSDPANLSKNMVAGRKIAARMVEALAEYYPQAFGGAYLATTAELMGIRETRRIVCDYTLTKEDYLAQRSFDDDIARNCYFSDLHPQDMEEHAWQVKRFQNKEEVTCAKLEKGQSHGIPYRCLAPRGVRNVLVAGRCISSDRAVQGSVRVMPVCLVTGEAAGLAAAMASDNRDADIHGIDIGRLRRRLREEGAYLP